MHTDERECFDALTELALGAVFEVSNNLGAGFLERGYQRALLRELLQVDLMAAAEFRESNPGLIRNRRSSAFIGGQ